MGVHGGTPFSGPDDRFRFYGWPFFAGQADLGTNVYYGAGGPMVDINATCAPAINALVAQAFFSGPGGTPNAIMMSVNILAALGQIRFGIYDTIPGNNARKPGALLFDSGDQSTAAAVPIVVPMVGFQFLPDKLYWFAYLPGTLAATLKASGQGNCFFGLYGQTDPSAGSGAPVWVIAQAYGALPATFPPAATINSFNQRLAFIGVRFP